VSYEQAIQYARQWAVATQHKSANAAACLAYIDAMSLAKAEARAMGQPESEGERVQLLYILSNLTGWRGPLAREAKEAIKRRIEELERAR